MTMNANYDVYFFQNFIEKYAQSTGKCVVYLRTYGWNHGTDMEKINQSIDVFSSIVPNDMMTVMRNSEFAFIEFDQEGLGEVVSFFEDNFPADQSSCDPEFYIHYSVYNHLGQIILSN